MSNITGNEPAMPIAPTSEWTSEDVLYGEILETSEDGVEVNCCLNTDLPTFQVRRFDALLLATVADLKIGVIVKIRICTKPGSRLIEILEETTDKSALFEQPDFFKGLEGNSFFIKG